VPALAQLTPPRWLKAVVFVLCLVPAAWVLWALYSDATGTTRFLGANPITEAEDFTGQWTLRFLAATLAITPLRRVLGWNWLIKYRRMLGLFTFAYVCIHLAMYVAVDYAFDGHAIVHDVVKHPYVTVGMAGFLLLVPLAVTSTRGWIRRLGGARWNRLHRLVYVVAVCGVVHYWWAVKKDVTDPLGFAILFAALFAIRLATRAGARVSREPAIPPSRSAAAP
jgi:sulfoxide reductase heme-binding subunit YedZ